MSKQTPTPVGIPAYVRLIDPVARRLLRWGVPMGPDRLLTIRGRRSGKPRTTAIAVVEIDDRRWVIGTYGTVNWVRNLGAAGEAVIHLGRQRLPVTAREPSEDEAVTFFREEFTPYVVNLPWAARIWVPRELIRDPHHAAVTRPVFELFEQRD